jgi:hypothetical protein
LIEKEAEILEWAGLSNAELRKLEDDDKLFPGFRQRELKRLAKENRKRKSRL